MDTDIITRGRGSVAVDLKHPDGVAVLKRLAAQADVLVENFRPDVKTRLGIDYEAIRQPTKITKSTTRMYRHPPTARPTKNGASRDHMVKPPS